MQAGRRQLVDRRQRALAPKTDRQIRGLSVRDTKHTLLSVPDILLIVSAELIDASPIA